MKATWLCGLLVLAVAALAGAREAKISTDPNEAYFRDLEAQWGKAYITGDVAFLDKLYADDLVFIGPSGGVESKKDELESVRSGKLRFESFEVSDLLVRSYGDTAVVTSKSTVKGNFQGQSINGVYRSADVFVRQQGAWRCVSAQVTPVR